LQGREVDEKLPKSWYKFGVFCPCRKEKGMYDLKHTDLNEELKGRGTLFYHGRDKDGKRLLVMRIRGAIHQLLSIILKLRILVLLPVSTLPNVIKELKLKIIL
jgi:hypothetical protein